MGLKKLVLGIILAFTTTGAVATGMYESDYQEVHQAHSQHELKMKTAIQSEFISSSDKEVLKQDLKNYKQIKSSAVKRVLRDHIHKEKINLAKVNKNLSKKEAKVSQQEFVILSKKVSQLNEKSKEAFILKDDVELLAVLEEKTNKLEHSEKVEPIRLLSSTVADISSQMTENQTNVKSIVNKLKEHNKKTKELTNEKYVLVADKKLLEIDHSENKKFFDNADDLFLLSNKQSESENLINAVKSRITDTKKDFTANESKSKDIISAVENLLTDGNLTEEEMTQLKNEKEKLKETVDLKNYQPGDLLVHYEPLKSDYDTFLANSDKRIEEEKKQAELKAKQEETKRQEEAKKQEAEAAANNQPGAPILVGDWYQAPEGFKFLKAESGKTYGQVKNPQNFRLISVGEAQNYSPGHGNGSAKQ